MLLRRDWRKGDRDFLHLHTERVVLRDVDGMCVTEARSATAIRLLQDRHGFVPVPDGEPVAMPAAAAPAPPAPAAPAAPPARPAQSKGDLMSRAAALGIKGRSRMGLDELTAAVAAAEAAQP